MHQAALNIQDHLDLWKFFSEDAAKIKDKLWAYGLIGIALALAALPLCAHSKTAWSILNNSIC